MGNRSSSILASVKGIVSFALIISLVSPTYAADGAKQTESDKVLRQRITRIANTTVQLTEADVSTIQKLSYSKSFEAGLAGIIRFDQVLLNFERMEDATLRANLTGALITFLQKQTTIEHNVYLQALIKRTEEKLIQFRGLAASHSALISDIQVKLANPNVALDAAGQLRTRMNQLMYEAQFFKALIVQFEKIEGFLGALKTEIFRVRSESPKIGSIAVIDHWLKRFNPDNGLTDQQEIQKNYLEDVERIEDYMKARVIEQDKAVESLISIEVEKHVKGYTRETPVVRYLMGLPGTGKDTLVENYVDAIHNKKGAWREHMFRFPTVKEAKDVWSILGSGKGYVGSEEITDAVKFIVNHSGGRYIIKSEKNIFGKIENSVIQNPNWKGKHLPGYFTPEDAVIFINEGHNWSSQAKDALLKQAVEKGYYKTNGVNGGVEALYSPITIIFATNEGIELLTSRDENGRQNGRNKTDAELLEAYNLYEGNKDALRASLRANNGVGAGGQGETLGMSEEFNNRIKDEELILLKPLSPEGKKKIARLKFNDIAQAVAKEAGGFGQLKLGFSDALVEFVQQYKDNPETGARPIDGKIDAVMRDFYAAVKNKEISYLTATDITLDIEKNADKTYTLVFKYADSGNTVYKKILAFTERDRELGKMNYSEFDRLAQLPETLKRKIYGNDEAMERIGKSVAITQQAREAYQNNRTEHKKATSFGLFGYAGLGKTQTAKELTRELTGKEDYLMIDFTNIKTQEDIEKALIGQKQGSRVIPSEFMKGYDKKAGGTFVVLLEETANTHPDLLKSLYPFFDEAEVRVFADGKSRPMSNVVFLVTGNAGLEVYNDILKLNLPRDVKMQAMSWVYESFIRDSRAQLTALSKTMPIPLMTRFTDIFHYRPVNYEILRNLSQRGLAQSIKNLKPKDGLIGWEVGFKTEADYYKTIEIIERNGFEFENQGRSVVNYTTRVFDTDLKYLLSKNHIPEGAKVALAPRERSGSKQIVDVYVEGRADALQFEMETQPEEKKTRENPDDHKRTAIHEAGHNIVMRLLLNDKINVEFLSIVPGVTRILNEYIFYLGVAKFSQGERMANTRQAVIEQIAVDAAGAAAQRLVSKGRVDDGGKSNDNKQSTYLARKAVMQWGLSPRFNQHIDYNNASDMNLLSENDKKIISEEVSKLIAEGNTLAEKVLKANPELLHTLANELLLKGEMDKAALDKFYEEHKDKVVAIDAPAQQTKESLWSRAVNAASSAIGWSSKDVKNHNAEFIDGIQLTDDIADIEKIVGEERLKLLAKVPKPEIPLVNVDVVKAETTAAVRSEAPARAEATEEAFVSGSVCARLFN